MPRRIVDPKLAREIAEALMRARAEKRPPTDAEWRRAEELWLQTGRKPRRGDLSEARLRELIEYMEARIEEGATIEQAARKAAGVQAGIPLDPPQKVPDDALRPMNRPLITSKEQVKLFEITDRWPLEVEALIRLYQKHRPKKHRPIVNTR
jgi:hypothetical protein